MNEQQFKNRTKQLALRVIRLADALPPGRSADVIGKQIVRAATSVGANYRAACRGRSDATMIAKLDIVLEEADETLYLHSAIYNRPMSRRNCMPSKLIFSTTS
jgi:four helix bundle protein